MPLVYGDPDKLVEWALLAEKCGFDSIGMIDHLFHPSGLFSDPAFDVWITLTAIGARTKKVDLMPVVTDPVRRHPATTAHMLATLDQFTKGRALLQIGSGEAFNIKPLGISWEKPVSKLREAVEVIRRLLEASERQPATFEGKYFSIRNVHLGLDLFRKPRPPIYVGGWGPRTRALAGALGDGWTPWGESPESYAGAAEDVRKAATLAKRSEREFIFANELPTAISNNSEASWKALAPSCRRMLAIRGDLLHRLGFEIADVEKLRMNECMFHTTDRELLTRVMNQIPMEAIRSVAIGGTPDEAIEQIERFKRAGVNELMLAPIGSEFDTTVKMYQQHIIPYFKSN
jgi:alkanesulfonate monooxygenase SsuD/methylene tetrahydromethanopterin reductase-like flavin-dependent oxidoreductase (luciferase family)